MPSPATTVAEYLAALPPDRRNALLAVRDVILKNLDPVYQEGVKYGMIGYCVPHRAFPEGYHCDPTQPLPFAALAAQRNHCSVHLMGLYAAGEDTQSWFKKAWAKTGKKLDMGRACIRFRKADDLALDVLGEAIRRMPAKRYVEIYTQARAAAAAGRATPARKPKPGAKRAAAKGKAKTSRGRRPTAR